MIEGVLVASTTPGRYAIGNAETGADVTAGQPCEILLGGQWLRGSVEYDTGRYAVEGPRATRGYFFIAQMGGVCGLCVGMQLRLH